MSGNRQLEQEDYSRRLASVTTRVSRLESILNGQPIADVKIASLSASKLLAGIISVAIGVGSENIEIDGENNRIIIYDSTGTPRILIGYQEAGF